MSNKLFEQMLKDYESMIDSYESIISHFEKEVMACISSLLNINENDDTLYHVNEEIRFISSKTLSDKVTLLASLVSDTSKLFDSQKADTLMASKIIRSITTNIRFLNKELAFVIDTGEKEPILLKLPSAIRQQITEKSVYECDICKKPNLLQSGICKECYTLEVTKVTELATEAMVSDYSELQDAIAIAFDSEVTVSKCIAESIKYIRARENAKLKDVYWDFR